MVIFDVGLNGLPQDEWVKLTNAQKKQYAKNIFDLIDSAYRDIGGHPNYGRPRNVYIDEGASNYLAIDLDADPDIDAIKVSKTKPSGEKFVATGQDGTKAAKRAVLKYTERQLKKPYHYVEVSGKLKEILLSRGVPVIRNPKKIREILKGKQIRLHGDGTYSRKIGNKVFRKILLGTPK